jgi:MFS family permease
MTFIVAAVFAIGCLAVVGFLPKITHSSSRRSAASGAKEVLALRSTWVGILGVLAIAAIFAAVYSFLPLLADERTIVGVGLAISIYAVFELLGQRVGGPLGVKMGRRRVIPVALLMAVIGILFFMVARTTFTMIIGAVLVGFFGALHRVNLDTVVMEGTPEDLRATAIGFEYAGLDTFGGVLNLGLGFIAVSSPYSVVYLVTAAVPALTIPIMLALLPRRKVPAQQGT